jgi:4'-phosphopantetheinyl transferase EntD
MDSDFKKPPNLPSPSLVALPQAGRDSLRLFVATFDPERFELAAYASAGLDCPVSIRTSVRKRQAEFYFGRIAARAALRHEGARLLDVGIGGEREPVWPDGFVGSISHTRGWAGAVAGAAARHAGLGIDLEHRVTDSAVSALEQLALDAAELEVLNRASATLPHDARVTLAFSAKESFYKAVFGMVRRFLDFDVVRVVALDEREGAMVLRIAHDLHPRLPAGAHCRVGFAPLSEHVFVTWFDAGDAVPARRP